MCLPMTKFKVELQCQLKNNSVIMEFDDETMIALINLYPYKLRQNDTLKILTQIASSRP